MAGSRLHRFGTIFSRTTGLLRSGAMKEEDKPIWYDVYAAFPPKYEPTYFRPAIDKEIQEILYPEDVIRAKFYKRFGSPGLIHLNDTNPRTRLLSERFLEQYQELSTRGNYANEDDLFEAAVNALQMQGINLGQKPQTKGSEQTTN